MSTLLTAEEFLAAPALLAERIETERLISAQDVLSPEDQKASNEARAQVHEALDDIIFNLGKAITEKEDAATMLLEPEDDVQPFTDNSPPKGKEFNKAVDTGVKEQSESLETLAAAIEPIITKFDETLKLPNLKSYSATLTTVPILGLKGNNIMYTKKTASRVGTVQDVWAEFGPLPDGVNITSATATHFFPYKGDLCMAVGQSVWRIKHRTTADPELSKAVNDWPKLFYSQWEKVGDKCLPDANAKSVIPYSVLSADRKQIEFRLLMLSANNQMYFLQGDDIRANNTWSTMSNATKNGVGSGVQWKKIAYWNDRIVALDNDNNTWNMKPDFQKSTFELADKYQVQTLSEMTATNIGPVGVGTDGYLYQRVVEVPAEATKEGDMKFSWQKFIQQNGVTNIGCASAGVMLDLNLLTSTLRSRYIDTQTKLYPIVDKLNAFSITHEFFLKQLMESAKDYANAGDSEKKQQVALKEGKKIAKHAMIWAKIMNSTVGKSKEALNLMTDEVREIKSQIEVKIVELKQKFEVLKSQLAANEEAYKKLSAAFWGAIAAAIVGLGIAIVGVVTGVGWGVALAGGALFVGGLVAACILGAKMSDLAAAITKIKQEMKDVSTAITELSYIQSNYADISVMYGKLNSFWGKFYNMTSQVKNMDDATLQLIGAETLDDTSSIEASLDVTKKMTRGAGAYLASLNKQGFKLEETEDPESDASFALADFTQQGQTSPTANPDTLIKNAQDALQAGDFDKYEENLEAAHFLSFIPTLGLGAILPGIISGVPWLDLSAVSNNVALLNGRFDSSIDVPEARAMNQRIIEAKPKVLGMLDQVIALTDQAEAWSSSVPDFPVSHRQVFEAEDHRKRAIKTCLDAQNRTAETRNLFVIISNSATSLQRELELKINQFKNDRERLNQAQEADWNSFKRDGANILVPNDILRPGFEARWRPRFMEIEGRIRAYEIAVNTGGTFSNQSQTWQKLCETVNSNLGTMYNALTAIRLEVSEDAALYRKLLSGQWQSLRNNSNEVRRALGNQPQQDGAFGDLETASILSGATLASNDTVLAQAMSPQTNLVPLLFGQALDATDMVHHFENMRRFTQLDDILATDAAKASAQLTLGQTLLEVRLSYSNMMSYEYDVVQQLSTLAIMQPYRLRKLAAGRNKVSSILKGTEISLNLACRSAEEARREYVAGTTQFINATATAKAVASKVRGQLADFRKELAKRDKEYKDRVVGMILYAAINGFAAGAVVAGVIYGAVAAPAVGAGSAIIPGLGGLISIISDDEVEKPDTPREKSAVNGTGAPTIPATTSTTMKPSSADATPKEKPDEKQETGKPSIDDKIKKVQDGIQQAQGAWGKFVQIRNKVKDATQATELGRAIFGDVSLEVLAIIVASLQSAVKSMENALAGLEALHTPLVRLRESVDGTLVAMQTMKESLQAVLSAEDADTLSLTNDQATEITRLWEKTGSASERWLDVINDQGIRISALN